MPIEFLPTRLPTADYVPFQAERLQLWLEVFRRTLPEQTYPEHIQHAVQHAAEIAAAAVQAFDRQFSPKPEQEEPFK